MNEDDEPEVELSGEREGAPLDASNVPIIVTVSQVRRGWDCCSQYASLPENCNRLMVQSHTFAFQPLWLAHHRHSQPGEARLGGVSERQAGPAHACW
jgi:hypothetical protein